MTSTMARVIHLARSPALATRLYSTAPTEMPSSTRLRRAMLYVPGSNQKMLQKAINNPSVDSLCFDLEDSVTANQKPTARGLVFDALEQAQDLKAERCVRLNSLRTRYFEDDISTILKSPFLNTLVMPKVESASDVHRVAQLLDKAASPNVRIIASLESGKAIMFAREIAAASPRLSALLFAAEDYCASVGIQRTFSRSELYFARSVTVNAAKAFGLQAIDMVCIAYQDLAVLADESEEGSRMGFDGKQAIHPAQIDTIQGCYSPSADDISKAVKILERNAEAEEGGQGAFGLDGTMIDAPMLVQARLTVARAEAAGRDVIWTKEA